MAVVHCHGMNLRTVMLVVFAVVINVMPRCVGGSSLRINDWNRCSKIMDCPTCIKTTSCGWCDGGGDTDVCIYASQKSVVCSKREDDFIGSTPKGQHCPSTLFDGSSALVKAESGFGASGRKEDKVNYPYSLPPISKMKPKRLKAYLTGLMKKAHLELTAPGRIEELAEGR